jgi:protein SCO1/2
MRFQLILKILLLSFLGANGSIASSDKIEAGIDEQLGKKIPLDVHFTDESGRQINLGDLFNKTTIITFVYYNCPGICSPLLSEVADIINKSDLQPGKDYNVISISMDDRETYLQAAEKKKNFLQMIDKKMPEDAWRFLTGDSINIYKVTNAAGFYFKKQGDEIIHSGALIFLTKEGMITRYLFPGYNKKYGFSILPFDFKMAVTETAKGNTSPTVARFLQFCFSYDPEGKTYVLNLTRIFGVGILMLVVIFILFLKVKPKKENRITR